HARLLARPTSRMAGVDATRIPRPGVARFRTVVPRGVPGSARAWGAAVPVSHVRVALRGFRPPHGEDRAGRGPDHPVGDAAEGEALEAAVAARADHDVV